MSTTTTTTTEDQNTTTTTTEVPETTTTTTEVPEGDRASVNYPGGQASPSAERQGEVAIDKGANTPVVGGAHAGPDDDARVNEDNIENAKQDALRNSQGEYERRA